jgi:hypothetical protein
MFSLLCFWTFGGLNTVLMEPMFFTKLEMLTFILSQLHIITSEILV